ncbi:MAG: ribonuclease H-like domain-containing protein [Candidatus Omnitrophica bacterium]|nr:ribonuclease H-like domain-containing protein [Candidatus Omnitrophota bacterium]
MPQNYLVLDLETQKTFDAVGRNNLHRLKVSVVGVYDYLTDEYRIYEESEISVLEERLKTAELLIGFNIRRFDLAVLAPYLFLSVDTLPVLDLMEEIEKVRGHRVALHSVAQATLGVTKTGEGMNAVHLYEQGRIEELKRYCLNDVRLTKGIYDYGCRENRVFFISNRDWKKYEIPIAWNGSLSAKKEPSFPTTLF